MRAFGVELLKKPLKNSQSRLKMDVRAPGEGQYQFGPFRLDPAERLLTRDGVPVALTYRVFETLLALIRSPGRVLTKDELLEAVWPGRFMEEGSLTQAIFTLRKALSGGDGGGQYIVTAPGRGYSFTAPVQKLTAGATMGAMSSSAALPSQEEMQSSRWDRPAVRIVLASCALAFLAVGVVVTSNRDAPPASAKPNVLVLAEFQNLTNDPALGMVLGRVLEIDLAQSPFLSLMPPQQIGQTLRLMERPADSRLTPELAQELCARDRGNAVLSGAVARIGQHYLVTLQARDCGSGASIAQGKAEAGREEDVPAVLDALTVHIREGLRESSASIREFDMPIAQATTSSFEALKAFSLGEQARARGNNAAAIPLFQRAVELDSSFAVAYGELGSAYLSQSELEMARTYYRKAYDLRDRASEIEKLRIASHYEEFIGNIAEAIHTYTIWAQTYPLDWVPQSNLANLYTGIAQYPQAIEAGRQALRLNPGHANPYIVLARAYKRSNRFDDAKAIGRLAVLRGLDGSSIHNLLYEIAFVQNDFAGMAQQVAREKDKPGMPLMLDYEAWAAATAGKVKQAGVLFAQAVEAAQAQGPDHAEEISEFFTEEITMLSDFGLNDEARQLALQAPGLDGNDDAPFALAKAGAGERATVLATALGKRYPGSTMVADVDLPSIEAAVDLKQRRPNDAARVLQSALPFELRDFDIPTLLGQAALDMQAPDRAAAEFRKIIANRGVDGLTPLYPLAYLGLARALRLQGKLRESHAAYEMLFAFWKDADKDLPILRDARGEYSALPAVPPVR